MADYIPTMRSNYFRVKDPEEFKKMCNKFGLEVIQKSYDDIQHYGFLGYYGIPDYNTDKDEEIVFVDILSEHLLDDSVAIIQEIGYEKMRYLCGYAVAINSKGDLEEVSIDDIYKKAERLGKDITECAY